MVHSSPQTHGQGLATCYMATDTKLSHQELGRALGRGWPWGEGMAAPVVCYPAFYSLWPREAQDQIMVPSCPLLPWPFSHRFLQLSTKPLAWGPRSTHSPALHHTMVPQAAEGSPQGQGQLHTTRPLPNSPPNKIFWFMSRYLVLCFLWSFGGNLRGLFITVLITLNLYIFMYV